MSEPHFVGYKLFQYVCFAISNNLLVNTGDTFDSGVTLTPIHFHMSYFLPLMMINTDMDEADYNYYPVKDSATSLLEVWKKGQQ